MTLGLCKHVRFLQQRPFPNVLVMPARRYMNQLLRNAPNQEVAIDFNDEVSEALNNRRPIVALESALITNGVAPPTNLDIARKLEEIVRSQGAVPATIGILGGRVKIGLQDKELQLLADTGSNNAVKVSRRDIGPVIAQKGNGGTTISATLMFAARAGIKVWIPQFKLYSISCIV